MSIRPPRSNLEGVAIVRWRPAFFVVAAVVFGAYAFLSYVSVNMWFVILSSVGALGALSRARWMKRETPASIDVRDDQLLVDGSPICGLSDISSAFVVYGKGDSPTLRLLRRRRLAVELRVRDADHALAIMRTLGLGPTQWAATYRLPIQPGDEWKPWPIGLAALLAGGAAWRLLGLGWHDLNLLVWFLMIPVTLIYLIQLAFAPRLVVGADGVALAWRRRTRFLPYGEIVDVKVELRPSWVVDHQWLTMTLTDGTSVRIAVAVNLDANQIAGRIREAKAGMTAEAAVPAAILLVSGTPAERIKALRSLAHEDRRNYRAPSVSTEQLWQTLEDDSADPETRAAAAITLRERLDKHCQRRLRIVAATTAAPKLRAVIEIAADGDDDALEEALAALNYDAAKPVRRPAVPAVSHGRRPLGGPL